MKCTFKNVFLIFKIVIIMKYTKNILLALQFLLAKTKMIHCNNMLNLHVSSVTVQSNKNRYLNHFIHSFIIAIVIKIHKIRRRIYINIHLYFIKSVDYKHELNYCFIAER